MIDPRIAQRIHDELSGTATTLDPRSKQAVPPWSAQSPASVDAAIQGLLAHLGPTLSNEDFVQEAYFEVVGRNANNKELKKQLFRLRFLPLYTRAVFIRRLIAFRNRLRRLEPLGPVY